MRDKPRDMKYTQMNFRSEQFAAEFADHAEKAERKKREEITGEMQTDILR